MNVSQAIKQRFSCREYTQTAVPKEIIREILSLAGRAPSSVNMQPWQVAVVTGTSKQQLEDTLVQASADGMQPDIHVQSYPKQWFEPYNSRRKEVGKALYRSLAITREDTERQKQQWLKNYRAFDAPVMLLFFADNGLPEGSLLDMGLFMQNVMLLACEYDLASCAQFSLAQYSQVVVEQLPDFAGKKVVCGMALGYPDSDAPVNQWRTERVEYDEFVTEYE